jgi:tetratricopeptide (TPR) repeat protein
MERHYLICFYGVLFFTAFLSFSGNFLKTIVEYLFLRSRSFKMQKRQLPAKKGIGGFIVYGTLCMTLVLLCQISLFGLVLWNALAGEFLMAFSYGVGSLFYLWATGSYYISLPLTIYFHREYKRRSNFAAMDLTHRKAIKLLKALPFRRSLSVSTAISNLGLLRLCQGEYESGLQLFSEAAAYCEKDRRLAKSIPMIVLYNNIAVSYYRLDRLVEAEAFANKALEIAEQPRMVKSARIMAGAPLAVLATVKMQFGELESANEYYQKAIDFYETSPVPRVFTPSAFDQAKAFAYLGLALCCIKMEKKDESLSKFDKFMHFANEHAAQINTMALNSLNMLSNEYMNRKLYRQAETLLELAYSLGRDNPFHPEAKQTLNYYEKLYLLTERQNEVEDMRRWVKPVHTGLIEQKS